MVDYVKLNENSDGDDDNLRPNKRKVIKRRFNFKGFLLLVLVLFLVSSIISSISYSLTPKIAVVKINGPISTQKVSTFFGESMSSRDLAQTLYEIEADNSVKGVILDINSPGGSAVASEEISRAVESLKQKKPVYALINDVGASGAFWIAVSTDKVYASEMSTVGSIGVTSATLGFEDLIKQYNITYRRLTAGEHKDMGSPYRALTKDEEKIIQEMLDEIHVKFIEHIANSRNMSYSGVEEYATGEIFLGSKAKKIGFIDEIGYYPNVLADMKNITKSQNALVVVYEEEPTLLDILGINSYFKSPATQSQIRLQ